MESIITAILGFILGYLTGFDKMATEFKKHYPVEYMKYVNYRLSKSTRGR